MSDDGGDRVTAARPAVTPALRRPLAAAAAVAALAVVALGLAVGGGTVGLPVDDAVRTAVAAWWGPPGRVALLIDFAGDPKAVVAVVGVLAAGCLVLGRRRLAVVAVAGPVLTGLLTSGLKPVFDRTIHDESNLAYPSGHTASVTALALVVALVLVDVARARPVPAALLIVLLPAAAGVTMALSQVALDAHYPTDTVGGFCTAVAAVTAIALLVDGVADRTRR
jgi:undecaprenyl-diphosphatase